MSILDFLSNLVKKPSQHFLWERIPPERVHPTFEPFPVRPREDYFRLHLAEMFLASDRTWFTNWAPITHSVVRLGFGSRDAPTVEIPHVSGGMRLAGADASRLDRVVSRDHALTPLLPFRGGTVELAAGLLATKTADHLESMLDVMGQLSSLVAVPQVSAALAITKPLASGLNGLLQKADGGLHLGVQQTWVSESGTAADNVLAPGYVVAVHATREDLDPGRLWVKGGALQQGPSLEKAQPLTGHTYMLFRVEARAERDDWDQLSSIAEPFQNALAASVEGNAEVARTQLAAAKAAAIRAPELTRRDAIRVIQAMDAEVRAQGTLEVVHGRVSLHALVAAIGEPDDPAISDEALLAGG